MSVNDTRKSIKLSNGRTIDLTRGEFDELTVRSEWAVLDGKKPAKHPRDMTDKELAYALETTAWRKPRNPA